jgi:Eukaryotic translation initiation factor 3 subunit 8 N-terminus
MLPHMQNKMKINDWSAIQGLFDELIKRLDKARKVAEGITVPRVYVRMVVELEDFLNGAWCLRLSGLGWAAHISWSHGGVRKWWQTYETSC